MDISIKSLSPDLLNDFLFFFDNMIFTEHPDWSICYCFSFHFTGTKEQWNKEENRASAIKFINEGKMTGYLAFSKGNPVGWCNANNRLNYQRLMKYYDLVDNPDDTVCSVVCFLIHPDYRRRGVAQKILERICNDYRALNYDYIEAYPGKGALTSEGHYNGPLPLYERLDFTVWREYEEYYVVRKRLK
jgi:GNAT superfamily N-acetyltransferase